jgi:hypothetical protein
LSNPTNTLTFADFDHARARTCSLTVDPVALQATLIWNEDADPSDDEEEGDDGAAARDAVSPAGYRDLVYFDSAAPLREFVSVCAKGLLHACYAALVGEGGQPASEVRDEGEITTLLDTPLAAAAANLPGNVARHRVSVAQLEEVYATAAPSSLVSFVGERAEQLQRAWVADLPGRRSEGRYVWTKYPVLLDLFAPSLLTHVQLFKREGLFPLGKFVGNGLGHDYFGVLQVDPQGRTYVSTRSDVFAVAEHLDQLPQLLRDSPRGLAAR